MIKFLQFIVVLLDFGLTFFSLFVLPIIATLFFQQIYIRTQCKYKRFMEKPGRACVTCDYHWDCGRAKKSKEYERYSSLLLSDLHQAKKLFDEIQAEEKAGSKPNE